MLSDIPSELFPRFFYQMKSSLKNWKNNVKFYRRFTYLSEYSFGLTKKKKKVEDCRGFVPSHLFGSYL